MKLQDLDTLQFVFLNDQVQGAGWPYATATAAGVAKAGARTSINIWPNGIVYSTTSAAAGAAAGAATVNGPAFVSVGVNISY